MWLTRKLGRIYIQTWWGVILYLGLCTEDGNRQMLLTYDDVTVLQKCNSIEFCNDIHVTLYHLCGFQMGKLWLCVAHVDSLLLNKVAPQVCRDY